MLQYLFTRNCKIVGIHFFFFNQDELLYTIFETILSFKIECLKLNYYYHNLLLSSIQLNLEYKIK